MAITKSDFKSLPAQPNFPALERDVITYWQEINAVEYMKEVRKDCAAKVYLDGPITANGMPHYGHAITWSMKDVIPRYWSMKNYNVSRNLGWDCHGLPVEVEVEKKLGFVKKEDIEVYGIAKFNELCKQSILEFQGAMIEYETRLGRWLDMNEVYSTMDKDFIESIWWALKKMYEMGLLYESHKVVAYSTRAGTTLSSHEVADGGYKEFEDPAVTIAFKLCNAENEYILAWTTTPWTLPGNLLLAVGENVTYARVESAGNYYYLASERVMDVFANRPYKIVTEVSARELIDKEYEPVFEYFSEKRNEGCFKIVAASHATDQEGTGVVHLAPYGAEDFEVFLNQNISIFDYLDDTAHFTDMVPPYKGLFYKQANDRIIADLSEQGSLFHATTIVHRVAVCYRTGTPLIYKPIKSWYIAVSRLKDALLENNASINWLPEHFKTGASYQWLSNARDWALSRKRYWGTPLPVWINDMTGELVFVGSYEELQNLSGQAVTDPHRPYIDDITWQDDTSGGTYRRVTDVIDVWFDSGAVPFARHHYPFQGSEKFDKEFVADYISEGTDQVRLWFYTMHVLGQALFEKAPYKNVCVTGMLLDKQGKKLSKSKKNYEPLESVLDAFGGDALRYFLLTSPIVQGESPRFYNEVLVDARKEFFLPLWNCANYFLMYAQMYEFEISLTEPMSESILDKWILARVKETALSMDKKMSSYDVMGASRSLAPLVTDLSTWYIRRSRERIKEGDVTALRTLHYVLYVTLKLAAPFTPFISEVLFNHLGFRTLTGLKTVHADLYPEFVSLTADEEQILNNMALTRECVSTALAIRVSEGIKVRQPLSVLYIEALGEIDLESILYLDLIQEEVNVKSVQFGDVPANLPQSMSKDLVVHLETVVTPELKLEGAFRELVRTFQAIRKDMNLNVTDVVRAVCIDTPENREIVAIFEAEFKQKIGASEIIFGATNTLSL